MKVHRQSGVQVKFDHNGDRLGTFERTHHMAIADECPRCKVRPGFACRTGEGVELPTLFVHLERFEATL